MSTITMLGAGIMATALATPLTDNGHEVRLVGTHLDDDIIDAIRADRVHPGLGLPVPDAVTAYRFDEAEAAFDGVDRVLSGVNSFGVEWAGEQLSRLLRPGMHVIAIAKGMRAGEDGTLTILPHVLASQVDAGLRASTTWSAIAGPSIAGELASRRHTSVVFAGESSEALVSWRELFATDYYHVWTSTDLVGVEVCAATKNCYALAQGFTEGVLEAMGDAAGDRYVNFNYGSALFGQASVEMTQFMDLLGGRRETVLGLPGVGDCLVTSLGGRNVRLGKLVGSGMTCSAARATMPGVTLEGAAAIEVIGAAVEKLTERGIVPPERFPLMRHLYDVIARDAAVDLPWDAFFGEDGSGGERVL